MLRIILLGPLFTQAERVWNRILKEKISQESDGEFLITLPQDKAEKFIRGYNIDFDSLVADCLNNAESYDVAVAILDGPDADSGTCVEIGYRKGRNADLPIIGVRTDFRSSEDRGTNAMLRICDKKIYFPSFNESVIMLARNIIVEIRAVIKNKRS